MKYRVVTRVTEECIYEVEADNPKDAEAKSCEASPYATETLQEETLSIALLHEWVGPNRIVKYVHCSACGIIKRLDGKNSETCRGAPKITLRKAYSDPKGGPEFDAP